MQSNTLSRSQRRSSGRAIQKLSNTGTPREKLSLLTLTTLQKKIESYGNFLSMEHKQALLEVSDLYSKIIFGETQGRYVVALDCGLGKTLSVVSLISAIHNIGYNQRSIMICQSKISELCLMVDALVEAGVPEEKIGLVHSYIHDPAALVVDGEVMNPNGTVRRNHAAHPANAKVNSSQFQFLLVSHSRVKGKREIMQHTQFKGNQRTLTIWDESFISSEATSIGLRDLKTSIQEFENSNFNRVEIEEFLSWLKSSYDSLVTEENLQKQGNPVSLVTLPFLTQAQVTTYTNQTRLNGKDTRYELRANLRQLLQMSLDPMRISITGHESALQFNDSVSKELTNLVVLDASYRIRELVRIDPSLQEPSFFVHRHNLKSYEDVTLNRMNYYGSRAAAESYEKSPKIAKEIALVIKGIPLNEAVCLFTFKWNATQKIHHAQVIKNAITSQGIDIHGVVTLSDGSTKPRFIFKTWGMETGSNNASYCSHLFMAGVLRQQENSFLAQLVGQSKNMLREINQVALSEAIVSELAHLVYQAGLRSSARIVSNGKALPTQIYLILDEPKIEKTLQLIMSNLQIKPWIPQDPSLSKSEVLSSLTQRITSAFTELNIESSNVISVRSFKEKYGLSDIPAQSFSYSRDQALEDSSCLWMLPKGSRSFHRVFSNEVAP